MNKITIWIKLFLSISFFNLYSTELTTNVARKMKFYDLLHSLRLKAEKHIIKIQEDMYSQVRKFRDQKRYRLADNMTYRFAKAINFYSREVDSAFDNISQIIVIGGDKLDYEEASVQDKIRFIQYVRSELVKSFEDIMQLNINDIEGAFYAY
ncbi:MAG: hypothetical protein M0R03_19695 [Novosphingobium sp.]|nr:hypothetical protein [Novosphingobium sp.]